MAWPATGLALDRLPTLETGRVVLRELHPGDTADIFAMFSDAEVMRYWSREPMQAQSEAIELIEHLGFRREGLFRQRYRVAGEVQESVMLGLLARERPAA